MSMTTTTTAYADITEDDVLAFMRTLPKDKKNPRYKASKRTPLGVACRYKTLRKDKPSCIAGTMFYHFLTPEDWASPAILEGESGSDIARNFGFSEPIAGLLDCVQSYADGDKPWGYAVECAVDEIQANEA